MSRPIIIAENLGKQYHLGMLRQRNLRHGTGFTLREAITRKIDSGRRLLKGGKLAPFTVKKNDRILFSSYAGTEVKVEGEEYLLMSEDDVLAVIE